MPETYEYAPPALDITEWAAAFYSLDDDEIVVITDNFDSSDREHAYTVLVHEMIHVYQDRGRDLQTLSDTYATSFDRFLALRAIVEGEAEFYESLAEVELLGRSPDEVDWVGYFAEFRANVLAAAAATDVPSQQAVGLFPYPYGGKFIYEAYQAHARASIDSVFETPPDSVRQVVGGYYEWPDFLRNRDDLLNPHAVPILPDRYTYLGGRHESVWLLNTMLQRTAGYTGEWGSWVLRRLSQCASRRAEPSARRGLANPDRRLELLVERPARGRLPLAQRGERRSRHTRIHDRRRRCRARRHDRPGCSCSRTSMVGNRSKRCRPTRR